jgi:hypothetical protein
MRALRGAVGPGAACLQKVVLERRRVDLVIAEREEADHSGENDR